MSKGIYSSLFGDGSPTPKRKSIFDGLKTEKPEKIEKKKPESTPKTAEKTVPAAPTPVASDSLDIDIPVKNARFQNDDALKAVFQGKALSTGEKGEHVTKIQQSLLDLGFALPSGVDGGFGNETKLALKGFQTSQKLPATGVLDAKTLRALDEVAPAPGLKAWEDPNLSPKAYQPPQQIGDKLTRVVVDKSEHRLFLYDKDGGLEHIYPVATGQDATPTDPMIKIVNGKLKDPSDVGRRLWNNPKAFGTRLIDLSKYDPVSKKATGHGEEIHGTFVDSSVGTNASHGCMRMYNQDVEKLYDLLKQGDLVVVQE
ncbi:MAG: L,D-transpeptidase family protein [Bacteroidota bacterium]